MTRADDTFIVEKAIATTPSDVFRALADEALIRQGFTPPGTRRGAWTFGFRPGGTEPGRFDIRESEWIACVRTLAWNGRVHPTAPAAATRATTEAGRTPTVAGQGAHVPPSERPDRRKAGVRAQLDARAAPVA